jgi:polyisoprenyl-phosphate glycosyltransferase
MTIANPSLAIVVPCYNEEEMLPKTLTTLLGLRDSLISKGKINSQSKIYLVDDGSKDATWKILAAEADKNPALVAVKLSRNKGHQNALYAGLCTTTEDITVSIDADLQDDPVNIEAMVDEYLLGNEVVYGVRSARHTDTFFKRFTAEGYYHLMRSMGVDLVFNHADFRLISRRALEALKEYDESNLFLRGIVREVGFKSSVVAYERQAREAGESKYPLRKMLSFAWKGITAFSTAPLRMITVLGLLSGFASLLLILWVLSVRFFSDDAIPGWASVLLPLLFIGSVQLLCLGIIGEYLSKIYEEVKRRPKFHISDIVKKVE